MSFSRSYRSIGLLDVFDFRLFLTQRVVAVGKDLHLLEVLLNLLEEILEAPLRTGNKASITKEILSHVLIVAIEQGHICSS